MILIALPALWLLLTLALRLLYPLVAAPIAGIEAMSRARLLRQLACAPLAMALALATALYLPGSPLQPAHCHGSICTPHAPHDTAGWWLLAPLALITLPTIIHHLRMLRESWRLQRQWQRLSECGDGYRIVDTALPLACTIGLQHPEIYLSRGLLEQLEQRDIDIIVAHEQAHLKRRDNLWRWLATFATLRLCPGICRDMELAQEESCDCVAASRHGAIAVAETLLRCGRLMQQPHRLACAFFRDALGQRVQALLAPARRPLPQAASLGLPLALLVIATTAVMPLHLLLERIH
jgi:hypothetical protein